MCRDQTDRDASFIDRMEETFLDLFAEGQRRFAQPDDTLNKSRRFEPNVLLFEDRYRLPERDPVLIDQKIRIRIGLIRLGDGDRLRSSEGAEPSLQKPLGVSDSQIKRQVATSPQRRALARRRAQDSVDETCRARRRLAGQRKRLSKGSAIGGV